MFNQNCQLKINTMNETIDEEECTQLLDDFSKVPFEEKTHPTFLRIINQHNKENAWSNILAFYFDPKKEHKLGDLMLKSFFEALGKKMEIKNGIKVCPEFSTDSRKRIDLVIIADNFVLGIENKVDFWLHNDLEDYSMKIDCMANEMGCQSIKVILSKNQFCDKHGFVNLTYDRFIKYIEKNIKDYKSTANPEYLIFLEDFLRNIKNTIRFKEMIENNQSLLYFQNNYDLIEQLTYKFKETKEEAYDKFREIHDVIDTAKIEALMKVKYAIETTIDKSIEIEWVDDVIAFWIHINTPEGNIRIEIAIYRLYICCSAHSNCEIFQNRINDFENSKLEIDIFEDTKNVADIILNFVREIGDKAFTK